MTWKPIDTAPREHDVTFLLWVPDDAHEGANVFEGIRYADEWGSVVALASGGIDSARVAARATHWKPKGDGPHEWAEPVEWR